MRALDVTNVRDRRAAKLRRPRHSPARHDEFALAVRRDPDNRRHSIRKDRREGRKVSNAVMAQAKEVADRRLALRRIQRLHLQGTMPERRPIGNAKRIRRPSRRRMSRVPFG
jgi:hypothetical protein